MRRSTHASRKKAVATPQASPAFPPDCESGGCGKGEDEQENWRFLFERVARSLDPNIQVDRCAENQSGRNTMDAVAMPVSPAIVQQMN